MRKKIKIIKEILDDWDDTKIAGIFLSGINGEGEYKVWHHNGQLWVHCFYKDFVKVGHYKIWNKKGTLLNHIFYKEDGKEINLIN